MCGGPLPTFDYSPWGRESQATGNLFDAGLIAGTLACQQRRQDARRRNEYSRASQGWSL